ncbi:hypothetical protein [Glycocaulis sp.]|uniref:hypothetical protein n=1 Tax=Glycocaulis sp. TaxID=1969725 RepID=UPI003D252703
MRAVPVSARNLIAAAAFFVLAACGFQPLYGGQSAETLSNVTVSVSGDERLSYLTETALLERVGVSQGDAGTLSVTLRTGQQRLGVSADGQATRVALNVRASYQLSGRNPARGRVTERVVFETPSQPYALVAARSNAERRAAEMVADAVVRDVLANLRQRESARGRPDPAPAAYDPLEEPLDGDEPW